MDYNLLAYKTTLFVLGAFALYYVLYLIIYDKQISRR